MKVPDPQLDERATATVAAGIDALGDFHLVERIAVGGMASVWLGVDARSGRGVAVKRMRPELARDPEHRRAFVDEATLGLRLHHPNIVQTLELGTVITEHGTELFLVLELLHGRSLVEILREAARQERAVPISIALQLVRDAARGLHHAHELADEDGRPLSVVHRDISPHNVFVCDGGVAKIVDFGVAKVRQQAHRTPVGAIKGKLSYLAPEQLRGCTPDARLDVFSLGVVMHELLTGRPLFRCESDVETLNGILTATYPSPAELRAEVSPAVAAIAMRALQRDRARRLPSAAALADAIEAVAGVEGFRFDEAAVRAFVGSLFPGDVGRRAAYMGATDRLYAHLRGDAAPPAPRPRPRARGGWARATLLVTGVCLAAVAAAGAVHVLGEPPDDARVAIARPPRSSGPAALPPGPLVWPRARAAAVVAPASPKRRRPPDPGCAIYVSLTKGTPTVVCPKVPGRR